MRNRQNHPGSIFPRRRRDLATNNDAHSEITDPRTRRQTLSLRTTAHGDELDLENPHHPDAECAAAHPPADAVEPRP